ncbi:MAG: RHS repeat-associated core domain-containing protein [Firmicutes bacterium]|nr:RHS repeat-associated core domain-containing protein [Bacillota bacterium]
MTSYDGQKITYDNSGNLLEYRDGWNFNWQNGRQLSEISNPKRNIVAKFKYNEDGIRTCKNVSISESGQTKTQTTEFCLNDMQILSQKTSTIVTDSKGKIVNNTTDAITWILVDFGANLGFTYNDKTYYYVKNAQGDVVGILDQHYRHLANYTYNSWGKLVSITDEKGSDVTQDVTHIGNINPLRYRGYYYDNETQLYYLNTRYYDPNTCRFLNADEDPESGNNLFVYCLNNPVNYVDYDGRIAASTIVLVVGSVVGVLGGSLVGNAIVKHLKLRGKHYWLCVCGSATLLGIVGYFAAPAVFAAVKPVVLSAATTSAFMFNKLQVWIYRMLGFSDDWISKKATEFLIKHADKIGKSGTVSTQVGRPYQDSTLMIRNIMQSGKPVLDKSLKFGLKWIVKGTYWNMNKHNIKQATQGVYELIVDVLSLRIVHFVFKS